MLQLKDAGFENIKLIEESRNKTGLYIVCQTY
jgi:hypothetical protein